MVEKNCMIIDLKRKIIYSATEYYTFYSYKNSCRRRNFDLCYIKWIPPYVEQFNLNTDGVAKGNPRLVSVRGLIRDHNGRWIRGFYIRLGYTSNIVAKL